VQNIDGRIYGRYAPALGTYNALDFMTTLYLLIASRALVWQRLPMTRVTSEPGSKCQPLGLKGGLRMLVTDLADLVTGLDPRQT